MTKHPPKKLLVVDDEMEICNFIKMFFEQRGFRVLQAQSGDEAVRIAGESHPDIVLLDICMKVRDDGLTALPKILKVSPQTKVLMTTAISDDITMVRAKSLGASSYITKPLVLEDLEATVYREVGIKKK